MLSAPKIFSSLLNNLPPRPREVVSGRFGLEKAGSEGETLAAIGERLGVTRERVRQVEKFALDNLGKQITANAACSQILNRSKQYIKNAGGVIKKDSFLEYVADFISGLNEKHVALLIEASGAFCLYPEDKDFWTFYYLSDGHLKRATNFIEGWANFLDSHKPKVLEGSYHKHLKNFIKSQGVNKNYAKNYLGISKKIHVNSYGDVGLRYWPEIKPMTARDRIYLVLKKKGEPLHFEDITGEINKAKLSAELALAPTIHNELIKDERFVLVGRGIYALKEHGYEPGTAREVIHRILKSEGPLKLDDVVAHVKKQRFFKPNTIVINLQNKNFFERLADGRYKIREV